MEILKFAEPPKRSSRTNTKKRGGIMPLLAVVVSVAVVGGMSTTLAGTITLNSGASVEFGQGVVSTAACDTSITLNPTSAFTASNSSFYVDTLRLTNIGYESSATDGAGCLGKKLTFKAYNASNQLLTVDSGTAATSFYITIPTESGTATNDVANWTVGSASGIIVEDGSAANWALSGTNAKTDAGNNVSGRVTIAGLKIPSSVTRITIESSSS